MAVEPGTTTAAIVGTGISYTLTMLLGPVLGEYALIVGMGLLGTLVALSDSDNNPEDDHSISLYKIWVAAKFVFRGVSLSIAFSGVLTFAVLKMIPADYGVTPYAVIGAMSFAIGWTSNKWGSIKDAFIERLPKLFGRGRE